MARIAIGALLLTVLTTAHAAAESEPSDETVAIAEANEVDAVQLAGAVATTQLPPEQYLAAVGELKTPGAPAKGAIEAEGGHPPPFGWPIGGALGQRLYCIEELESHHGLAMYNPTPVGREHAQGFLGWLPSTAAHWGVQIGNRTSEWQGAARILGQGERFARTQFYGVGAGLC